MEGMASRGVKPAPRGKASGLPFYARFTDVAAEAGLRHPVVYGGVTGRDYVLEAIGSGAAFFDYNNDGWIDVFLPSGTRLEGAPEGAVNRLYRNNRDGTFADVTAGSGLERAGWASGVTVGDYDNDGDEDLFVTYFGQNALYRNDGDGKFTDVTAAAGLKTAKDLWGAGCTFLDYDRDGHLDLFVSRYLDFDFSRTPRKGQANCNWKGVQVHCGPRGLPKASHSLYRNRGDGAFADVTAAAGIAKAEPGYGLTAVAADFDGDGWVDIYVACDSTPSLLFINQRDGTFEEEGLLRGVALSDDGMEQAGMGVGVGDFDLDGHLDILKTHFSGDTPILYRNDGKGDFQDVTFATGLGVETRFVSWGGGIHDLDNDGLPDLFWVTGDVYPELEAKLPNLPLKTPRVLFRSLGRGRFEQLFEEAGAAIASSHCSRGVAFGDYDNDGDTDILIVNLNELPSLLRNDLKSENHWLKVQLEGAKSNRSAIGAVVVVKYGDRRQAQAVLGQQSFYSACDRRLHFGLGKSESADVEVRWPGGLRETFEGVKANRLLTIREGERRRGDATE
ncbi:MAG: CRTAC1 family protein [Bryobacteraceae bacterium]|nr:CRTAC1 family protein [Bryobacteraceae bacterium]